MSMDINIVLLPETESVYLLNGEFLEGESFVIEDDAVVYLTALPLDARFMPYTVRLIGGSVACEGPALMCKIGHNKYALKLDKRYGFAFSKHKNEPTDLCARFFYYVKGKHFGFASEMLSKELRNGLGEAEMSAFLHDYIDLIKVSDSYFAVDKAGCGHRCFFSIKDNKIDNISIE